MFVCDGSVTTLCACAFAKTTPSEASLSRNGVLTLVLPEKPTESARSVSMVTRMMSGLSPPGATAFSGRWQADRAATMSRSVARRIGIVESAAIRRLQLPVGGEAAEAAPGPEARAAAVADRLQRLADGDVRRRRRRRFFERE